MPSPHPAPVDGPATAFSPHRHDSVDATAAPPRRAPLSLTAPSRSATRPRANANTLSVGSNASTVVVSPNPKVFLVFWAPVVQRTRAAPPTLTTELLPRPFRPSRHLGHDPDPILASRAKGFDNLRNPRHAT